MKWWPYDICSPLLYAAIEVLYISFPSMPVQSWVFLIPWGYSATGHSINCKGLAQGLPLYNSHHCLLLSTHLHLGRGVGVVGLSRVHSVPSHYCPIVKRPDSEICILAWSSIECPTLSVQRLSIQVLTIPPWLSLDDEERDNQDWEVKKEKKSSWQNLQTSKAAEHKETAWGSVCSWWTSPA